MRDYLLDLLEEVEEVFAETAELSLSLPQEDGGTPNRGRGTARVSREEARELLVEGFVPEDTGLLAKKSPQAQGEFPTGSHSASEELLENRLLKVCAIATPRHYKPSKAILEEVEQGSSSPGVGLLQRMQQISRLAEVGGGVHFTTAAPRFVQEERTGKPSYREFLAFDRAVERDARCYDNGFSLL